MTARLNLSPAAKKARAKAKAAARYAANSSAILAKQKLYREAQKASGTNNSSIISKRSYNNKKVKSKDNAMPILREMLTSARTRAKAMNRQFAIEIEDLTLIWTEQNRICNMSGLEMSTEIGGGNDKASLDRIDSSKGYIKGNLQFVVAPLNSLKGNLDKAEFIELCKRVAANNP